MTFIDHKTSREAQAARNASKDRKGRPNGKFPTPDRPGTNLSYSVTGRTERRPQTALEAALTDAGITAKPKGRKPRKRTHKPADTRPAPRPANRIDHAAAMRKVAEAANRETR